MKYKSTVIAVVTGLAVSFIVLIGAETAMRILLPFPLSSRGTYEVAPDILYFHKAGSRGYELSAEGEFKPVLLRYNRFGFRGAWTNFPREKERVAVMGDSFVEARQVAESATIPELLNKKFSRMFFFNAGCSAYTTTTAYLLFKHRILALKPKKVVLFFSFNDYRDNFVYQGGYFRQKDIFQNLPWRSFLPGDYEAPQEWNVDRFVEQFALTSYLKLLLIQPKRAARSADPERERFETSFWAVNKPTQAMNAREREVLEFTHRGLLEFALLARQQGITLHIFVIPLPIQVSKEEWVEGKRYFGYSNDYFETSTVYQQRIMKFCQKHGLDCVDLLPDFRERSITHRLFFDFDGHWTEAGNQIAAEVVARKLRLESPEKPPAARAPVQKLCESDHHYRSECRLIYAISERPNYLKWLGVHWYF